MEHLPTPDVSTSALYSDIRNILTAARQRAYAAVNFAMVESYWLIGQRIVEHEQKGAERAAYGKHLLKALAEKLTEDFGKGFDERELRKMRQFYTYFQKRDTLRPELSWSHYRRAGRILRPTCNICCSPSCRIVPPILLSNRLF